MRKPAAPILVALTVGAAVTVPLAPTLAADSAYTTVDEDACTVIDRGGDAGPGAVTHLRCEGLPGHPVLLARADRRMSLDYGAVDEPGRWESFAAFNRVHDTVEWRLEDGAPFATIHRWYVSEGGGERQVLVVSTVATGERPASCIAGLIDVAAVGTAGNARARELADETARAFRCGLDEPDYHGPVAEDAPQLVRAPAEPAEAAPASPAAMLRTFWDTVRAAPDAAALAPFRLDGTPGMERYIQLKALSERYRIASVEPLVVADGERRLAVVLRPRDGRTDAPRSAEVGVVEVDGRWRITTARW